MYRDMHPGLFHGQATEDDVALLMVPPVKLSLHVPVPRHVQLPSYFRLGTTLLQTVLQDFPTKTVQKFFISIVDSIVSPAA
jgi:hypothetical protein